MTVLQEHINKLELSNTDTNFVIIYNDNFYSVSELFYNIINEFKDNRHDKNKFIDDHNISSNDYDEIIDVVSEKINTIIVKEKSKKSYINLAVKILPEKAVISISKYLDIFFRKAFFTFFFPFVILVTVSLSVLINYKYTEHTIFEISLYDTIFIYAVTLVIMMFHELGHSSASSHFNIKPKEIGFGFYIFFPVLYSNVTRIWKLHKNDRVIVNLGGIYFQGIINCIFIVYILLNKEYTHFTYLLLLIMKTNIFVMAYSLFPFIRNDGYWVISDYFNIPNLNKKSYSYIVELIKRKEPINYSLMVYSIGQYLFVFYLAYKYLPNIPKTIIEFVNYLNVNSFIYLLKNDFGLFFRLIISTIIGFVMLSTLFKFIKPIFKDEKIDT
jgi:putative peptide zinc metalloprotease protein